MQEKQKKLTIGNDAAVLTFSKIMVALISMVTSMLLARFRTLEEYGTYSQIIMITNLVSTILLLGLPNSINYFLAKEESKEGKQKFLSVYLTVSTLLTIVIAICLILALPLIVSYFNNPLITAFAYVFAVYPWASLMIDSLSNTCIVYGKTNKLMIFNIVYAVITLVILLLTKVTGLSFRHYMLLYMGGMLGFAFFSVFWMKNMTGKIKCRLDYKLICEIFKFSIPMGLASVVGTLNIELDKFVIGRFFSTDEYAIFTNASKELPVTMLATSLTAVLLPNLVRLLKKNQPDAAVKMWGYSINISLCIMCLFVGGFFVFAPDIMSLFYSEKYVTADGCAVFRIYTLILLFRATYWGIILNAIGRTKFILYSSIMTLICNFVGNIIGYYTLGFIGPAVSSLVVTGVMAFIQLVFTCRVIKVGIKGIFPWKGIGRFLMQTLILGFAFSVIKYLLLPEYSRTISIISSVCLGILWSLVYLAANYKIIKINWSKMNGD